MKNIYRLLLIVSVVLLSTGCIKETFPKGSTVTQEQLEQSDEVLTYMLRGIPAAMGSTGTAGFFSTYGYHYDFGISANSYPSNIATLDGNTATSTNKMTFYDENNIQEEML